MEIKIKLEPIPLTNEWLEKFGFVKDKIDNTYYKDNLECEMNKDVPFLD